MNKLSKEVWLVVAIIAFLLSWLIDRLAGPVVITVGNPVAFLTSSVILNRYPFTAAAVIIRSIALFISAMLTVSIMEKQYFGKAVILLFTGVLAEFYAIQQLANGFKMTTIQWTLAIAYGSVLLALGIVSFILKGIWTMFNKDAAESATDGEKSILEPSQEE